MEPLKIEVEKRQNSEKASAVLAAGMLPIELYGPGVKENVSLKVDYQDFRRLFRKSNYNKVVELVEGKTSYLALVHHIQFHPATDQLMHVDMFAVDEKVPVTVKVPITFSGNSPVVRDMGGVLKYNLKKVKIKALIKDLVENINVDISVIDNFGAAVRVSNLVAPEGVEIVSKDQSALIVSGSAPRGQAYREDEEGSEESEESAEAEAPAATE